MSFKINKNLPPDASGLPTVTQSSLEEKIDGIYKLLEGMDKEGVYKEAFENIRKDLLRKPLKHLSFNQESVFHNLKTQQKTLKKIAAQYEGLCEIICNFMLENDLLGKDHKEASNPLKKLINADALNEKKIKSSHLLKNYPIHKRILAFFTRYYPDNIFSYSNQKKLINKSGDKRTVNREVLKQGFQKVEIGETIKFEVITKKGLKLNGHSLLIKKTAEDEYIFFDPNTGEDRNLSFKQLCDRMDDQISMFESTDIVLIKGKEFLKLLHKKIFIK